MIEIDAGIQDGNTNSLALGNGPCPLRIYLLDAIRDRFGSGTLLRSSLQMPVGTEAGSMTGDVVFDLGDVTILSQDLDFALGELHAYDRRFVSIYVVADNLIFDRRAADTLGQSCCVKKMCTCSFR